MPSPTTTPTTTTKILISPCTLPDAPSLARNNISAFWTDPTWPLIWRGKTLNHVISQATLRMPATLLKDPTHARHQKAIDGATGKVVGYARWVLPSMDGGGKKAVIEEEGGKEEGKEDDDDGESDRQVNNWWISARVPDAAANISDARRAEIEAAKNGADWSYDRSLDVLDEPMLAMKERLMKGKKHMLLEYLAVPPTHRNRGIASLLVSSGLTAARQLGLDVFVHGMKAGLGVYERAGFRLLDHVIVDDSRFGGKGEYGSYFLVWEGGVGDGGDGKKGDGEKRG